MKLNIHGEINNEMIQRIADELEANYVEGETIELDFNSVGGYIEAADIIVDILQQAKSYGSKIIARNSGDVMSSATIIWLFADDRIWDNNYKFLIHNPYLENISGDVDSLLEQVKGLITVEDDLANLYSIVSEKDKTYLFEIMAENRPLTLDELQKLNFITHKVKTVRKYNKMQNITKK